MFRARGLVIIVIAAAALSGCGTQTASYADTAAIARPAFAPPPPEPGASPQLDAVVLRDTGGVESVEPNADPALVAPALAALQAAVPGISELSDFWFEDDSVYFTFPDPAFRGRAVSGHYDGEMHLGSPSFSDSPTFPIEAIDPAVAIAVVEGLASRFPTLRVIRPRLNPELSHELGLSWHVDLDDGRGNLGTVYTDLDGTVTVVDVRP